MFTFSREGSAATRALQSQFRSVYHTSWAQLNAFEAFPLFAAAVIIAHLARADQAWINGFAVAFIGLRIAYTLAYLYDKPTLRSLVWAGGLLCVIGLFVVAA